MSPNINPIVKQMIPKVELMKIPLINAKKTAAKPIQPPRRYDFIRDIKVIIVGINQNRREYIGFGDNVCIIVENALIISVSGLIPE